ncbi:hypothetical protein PO124_31105 [Bacillus licheniformis]|nr:hypothetical protein [Bacillus licheniformis]
MPEFGTIHQPANPSIQRSMLSANERMLQAMASVIKEGTSYECSGKSFAIKNKVFEALETDPALLLLADPANILNLRCRLASKANQLISSYRNWTTELPSGLMESRSRTALSIKLMYTTIHPAIRFGCRYRGHE